MRLRGFNLARLAAVLGSGLLQAVSPATAADEGAVNFTRQIRPILSNRCFQCHGPDVGTRETDLRLDTKAGLFVEGSEGPVVVAGAPDRSALYLRVSSDDPDFRMPPPDADHPALTAEEVDLVRRWIEQGATWEEHWAFVAPQRPALPDAAALGEAGATWCRNEIDRFVLAKLREHKLAPAGEATREALIRRVTYDLTGLPPTLEEIDAFLADQSPDAYQTLVDRLLRSPHYGEHMTRYWLDAARYGDTHGLHLDNVRSLWPYRDWLIRSFNDNKPFDQMTIEQIAGDLLPNATIEQRVATGFNRCNVTTSEGGSIAEEYYVRYAVDRVSTMGTVYLGLTLGCAVCHDHKYDPISQKEFYGLFAYFNSLNENPMDGNALLPPPFMDVPTPEQSAQREEIQSRLAAAQDALNTATAAIQYVDPEADTEPPAEDAAKDPRKRTDYVWIDDAAPAGAALQPSAGDWEFVAAPAPVFSGENSMKRTAEGLSQHFFTGANPELIVSKGDTFFAYVYLDPDNPPKEIMLQWNDGTWEHRAYWGDNLIEWGYDVTDSRRRIGDLPPLGQWTRLEVKSAVVGFKDGAKINGWAFTQHGGTVYWDQAGLVTATPQASQTFESQRLWELAVGEGKELPQPVQAALKIKPADRKEEHKETLRRHFLENVWPGSREQLAPLVAARDAVQKKLEQINEAIPKTMIVEELKEPKQAFVLLRGEYDKPADPVSRFLPAALPPVDEDEPVNRLGLARWLVDPSHPLTSRVTVNRWWQRFFGTGLVKTSEDFGIQGESPSHPELLDWLAVEFIESGWDVKRIQKLIVMSAAYRQDAAVTPQKLARDPENRLVSRGPRFRLEAEAIRDTALYVSGLLNDEIGGPSVKPYQPSGLWEAVGYTNSNTANFTQDDGEKLYRRSMYTFWKRTSHAPSMAMFDAPSREACTVRRARTNTPLQALALMNDKQFVEASRHFAGRILREGGDTDEARLQFAFRLLTARRADARELSVLQGVLQRHRADFTSRPEDAGRFLDAATTLLKPNHLARDKSQDAELAAWTMLASLLMNLDEAVTKG
jgi:hypothetical protein